MKKLIFFFATLFLFCQAGLAQNKVSIQYYDNGSKLSQGMYIGDFEISEGDSKEEQAEKMANATKDGKWSYWYDNGKLSSEEYYENGTHTGVWRTWYVDGRMASEINFETNKAIYWFANGNKQSEGVMIKMTRDGRQGLWSGWHENGVKNFEGYYKDGQKDGVWLWWNEQNEKIFEETYRNGKRIGIKDISKQ